MLVGSMVDYTYPTLFGIKILHPKLLSMSNSHILCILNWDKNNKSK
jgi:hypothetical protein